MSKTYTTKYTFGDTVYWRMRGEICHGKVSYIRISDQYKYGGNILYGVLIPGFEDDGYIYDGLINEYSLHPTEEEAMANEEAVTASSGFHGGY